MIDYDNFKMWKRACFNVFFGVDIALTTVTCNYFTFIIEILVVYFAWIWEGFFWETYRFCIIPW